MLKLFLFSVDQSLSEENFWRDYADQLVAIEQ